MQQNSKDSACGSCLVQCLCCDLTLLVCRGCLLVRQSFFHNEPKNFTDLGGGVLGCRGFHSSFRATQGGLSLNIGKFLYCVVASLSIYLSFFLLCYFLV